ncbi:hypothetical protein [Halocatena pleomorpha]|uniref:Uncharacterized protein n=1 Tax=Halocatena pleomorpha TaxID=1785090 RepID=A0A3P3R4J8_9EURY|nr:hypothetical protein [Halocatena pleomorpha]RRJ28417.1 hypothetical protein EIK79_15695 [Halocatena pleomorpha]
MDRERLDTALDVFDSTPDERRVVIRQAIDLYDSDRFEKDAGTELTADVIVDNLQDAPDDRLADRWNWWIGALTIAYGGYERFQVRAMNR